LKTYLINNKENSMLVNLGTVVNYEKGKKPKLLASSHSNDVHLPYINIKAFEKGIFDEYTNGEKCTLCKEGDLLMVWDGARAGYTGKAKVGAVGSTLMKIEPKDGLDKEYLFYFLQSLFRKLNTNPRGVGIPHVEPSLLWNAQLPLPPLPFQQAIVTKLEALFSELDKGIEQLKTAQQQLRTYRQAVLKAAFEGKLTGESRNHDLHDDEITGIWQNQSPSKNQMNHSADGLPEGWKWVTVGDIADNVEYGSAAKSKESGKVPVLRMGNIQNGIFEWDDLVFTDDDIEINKYKLHKDDVLFNRTNSPELVGKTAIYKGERPAIFAGYLIRINYKKNLILGPYLTYYLNTKAAKEYGNSVRSFGVNQSNINGTKLKTYPIPLAPIEQQTKIISEIESRLSVADKMEEAIAQGLQQAEALRQSILKKAFEGELNISMP
jgi:type I restriction enzyme S subunit